MNTQTHVLLGAALFARAGLPAQSLAAVAGGLAPDLPLYAFFVGARTAGYDNAAVFDVLYWREPMPTLLGASHSFVLLGLLLAGGLLWRRRAAASGRRANADTPGAALTVFALAALLHAASDFLLHRDDAHMQFWPLSRWTFASPVSYWDPAHFGTWWSAAEALLGIACAFVVWRRFRHLLVRGLAGLAIAMYAAVPLYFVLSIPGHQM